MATRSTAAAAAVVPMTAEAVVPMTAAVLAVTKAYRPTFRDGKPSDVTAFAIHAYFMVAGYSLLATAKNALSDHPPTDGEEVGIEGWNELDDRYGFVYLKSGSKEVILVKCLPIGDTLMVEVLNLKEENFEPLHLQISVKDHTSDKKGTSYENMQGLLETIYTKIFKHLDRKVTGSPSNRIKCILDDPIAEAMNKDRKQIRKFARAWKGLQIGKKLIVSGFLQMSKRYARRHGLDMAKLCSRNQERSGGAMDSRSTRTPLIDGTEESGIRVLPSSHEIEEPDVDWLEASEAQIPLCKMHLVANATAGKSHLYLPDSFVKAHKFPTSYNQMCKIMLESGEDYYVLYMGRRQFLSAGWRELVKNYGVVKDDELELDYFGSYTFKMRIIKMGR